MTLSQAIRSDQASQFEALLEAELRGLSSVEREAVCGSLGVDGLSSTSVMRVLRAGSGVWAAQAILGSTGFGAFLFLSTLMKAVSLLLGTTFAFESYMAAASGLAFVLSWPFLLITFAGSGFLTYRFLRNQLDDRMRQMILIMGRGRLLSQGLPEAAATL